MKVFTIDSENNITVFASSKEIGTKGNGAETFSSLEELSALASRWVSARCLEIWNSLSRCRAGSEIHQSASAGQTDLESDSEPGARR